MSKRKIEQESVITNKKPVIQCPFLDRINRHVLDFDFEKLCSITLSNQNVYVCLICGKYFQGRGKSTPAYTHALQAQHQVFMNLNTGKIYCLPGNYEVIDSSLNDIKYNLRPTYQKEEIEALDKNATLSQDLFGVSYLPGFVGLNNLKHTDYVNVVVQALTHIPSLRDYFLDRSNYSASTCKVVHAFGDLVCSLWSKRKFKGSVSPHELIQVVSSASKKRFKIGKPNEAIHFLSWFLNRLHVGVGGTKEPGSSIIHRCFQGHVKTVTTDNEGNKVGDTSNPFLLLSLELPAAPLFKDAKDGRSILPQIPLYELLSKFDGTTTTDIVDDGVVKHKRYVISQLPKYLIFYVKRFSKNNWYVEKNQTIVNFPIKNLQLKDYLTTNKDYPSSEAILSMSIKELKELAKGMDLDTTSIVEKEDLVKQVQEKLSSVLGTTYNLISNICHDLPDDKEKSKNSNPVEIGSYRVHVQNKASSQWYEIQDLYVRETMPQLISLSETYMMIYEKAS